MQTNKREFVELTVDEVASIPNGSFELILITNDGENIHEVEFEIDKQRLKIVANNKGLITFEREVIK